MFIKGDESLYTINKMLKEKEKKREEKFKGKNANNWVNLARAGEECKVTWLLQFHTFIIYFCTRVLEVNHDNEYYYSFIIITNERSLIL